VRPVSRSLTIATHLMPSSAGRAECSDVQPVGSVCAVSSRECSHYAPTIPELLFATYELMFAVISPLLVTGAFAERMPFSAGERVPASLHRRCTRMPHARVPVRVSPCACLRVRLWPCPRLRVCVPSRCPCVPAPVSLYPSVCMPPTEHSDGVHRTLGAPHLLSSRAGHLVRSRRCSLWL
jgi:hypothetical protein